MARRDLQFVTRSPKSDRAGSVPGRAGPMRQRRERVRVSGMDVGLHALGIGTGADRDVIDAVASEAESCGFATLWAGEHVIAVEKSSSRYPYSPTGRIAVPAHVAWNDPMITLSFAAAATSSITLATGILLLPEHNPVIVAKQAATLDQLSKGRLVLGVGLGWSREEFEALGIPFARRGQRTEQYVRAMRTLWRDELASFQDDFVQFREVRMEPKPSNGSTIPVILGGNSDSALRRVAAWAEGWYGFYLDTVSDVADRLRTLRASILEAGRDGRPMRCSIALREPKPSDVKALGDLGVDEFVVVDSPPADPAQVTDWMHALAARWLT
jgi:probable F420-dependent oxidoreductase